MAYINIEDVDWRTYETVALEKTYLAHLLGMSFLIVR
ncbi:MAG: hypothetical protein ACI86M_003019 [Saprospiraceae bacterium]